MLVSKLENTRQRAQRAVRNLVFDYNTENADGRTLLYHQFPENYTWEPKQRAWESRLRGYCIGRIYHCSPVSGERYYLRLLLTAVPGPRSFEELYMVDGVRYLTYYAACIARAWPRTIKSRVPVL